MRIIGRKPVLELLRSGDPVQRVRIAVGTQGRIIGEIISAAKERGVRIDRVPQEVAKRTFGDGNHQGVIAEAAPVQLRDLKELIDGRIPIKHGLVVALDGVTDPHHLGAVARSALAAGCDALIMPQRRSAPLNDTSLKASAGTLTRIPVIVVGNLVDAILALQKADWWAHGAAGGEGRELWDHDFDERTILVIGSEGDGLAQRTRKVCDHLIQVPMMEGVESLSVSAAASVILFEIARRKR